MDTRHLTCQQCKSTWAAPTRGRPAKLCPSCRATAKRAQYRAWYHANSADVRARQAEYRRANVAEKRDSDRAYRLANRDAIRAQKRDYYRRNGVAMREWIAACRKRNPEQYREYTRRRKATLAAAFVAPVDDVMIYERDRGICQLCRGPVERSLRYPDPMSLTMDHVVPLVAGGTHEPGNVQLAHMRCNSRKGASLTS